jgi:hypothetical protein
VAFEDFGNFAEGSDRFIEVALVQFGADCGSYPAAERGRQHPAAVGAQEARRRHPLEARLHRSARQAEPLGQDHDRHAGVLIKGEEDPAVGCVEVLLQSAQFLSVVSVFDWSD